MRKLIIIGAGGHARVVAEIARLNGYKSVDFLADSVTGGVIGKTCEFIKYIDEADFVIAIGNAAVRQKFQMQLKENNASIIFKKNKKILKNLIKAEFRPPHKPHS